MPVKKINGNGKKTVAKKTTMSKTSECCPCPPTKSCYSKLCCSEHAGKIFITLFGILLVYIIVWIGTMIYNNLEESKYIGFADKLERTITVDAQGKITAKPNVAMVTLGMIAEGSTVDEAQTKNDEVLNNLNAGLKKLGISEDDIQTTNYNIYPRYNYTQYEGRVLEGYEMSQDVQVKIRDLEKANAVLALAGEVGANSVGGLQFTIDDTDVYKQQARNEALEKINEKATALANSLGVNLVSIVSYNEYEVGSSQPIYRAAYEDAAYGLGGAPSPQIEAGSMDVVMNVAVTFEIR